MTDNGGGTLAAETLDSFQVPIRRLCIYLTKLGSSPLWYLISLLIILPIEVVHDLPLDNTTFVGPEILSSSAVI